MNHFNITCCLTLLSWHILQPTICHDYSLVVKLFDCSIFRSEGLENIRNRYLDRNWSFWKYCILCIAGIKEKCSVYDSTLAFNIGVPFYLRFHRSKPCNALVFLEIYANLTYLFLRFNGTQQGAQGPSFDDSFVRLRY